MGVICIFLSHLGKLGLKAPITDIVIVSKRNVYQENKRPSWSSIRFQHRSLSFHKNWKGRFKNLKGFIIGGFSHLLVPSPPSLSFLFRPWFSFRPAESLTLQTTEKKKEASRKTASHALAELHKPFNSPKLISSVAPDESSDRQQQNSGRDTKWNVNNFVNTSGIFLCRCGSRGFYDCKQNKYIKLWSKVLYYKWKWGIFFQ